MRRRTFLETSSTAATVGLIALAGCGESGGGDGGDGGGGEGGQGGGGGQTPEGTETPEGTPEGTPAEGGTTVAMETEGDEYYYDPIGQYVESGATVTFSNESGSHSSTAYQEGNGGAEVTRIPENAEAWDSGVLGDRGATFEHAFETPGDLRLLLYSPQDSRDGRPDRRGRTGRPGRRRHAAGRRRSGERDDRRPGVGGVQRFQRLIVRGTGGERRTRT